jgi:hypothetical protein
MTTTKPDWALLTRVPQIDGGTRKVYVPRESLEAMRRIIRNDRAMIEWLPCAVMVRDC